MEPRFLVAKYAPCLRRMEPRNIGVFLWCRGSVAMKFLEPKQAKFVRDKKTYARWVEYWKRQVASDSIEQGRGHMVSRSSPAFMDALLETQNGNYILADAGFLCDDVPKREIDDAVSFLFEELVA